MEISKKTQKTPKIKETFIHTCIRIDCGKTYKDIDPDPYYCKSCRKEVRSIAQQVDERLKSKVSTRVAKSNLQVYDESPKIRGFVSSTALGITLN